MQLLYINADFDENGLETKIYDSIESFVQARIGIAYSLLELDAFNAYKVEKEIYVKELAQKYQNDIDERSYVALLNYKVDIND